MDNYPSKERLILELFAVKLDYNVKEHRFNIEVISGEKNIRHFWRLKYCT